MAIAPTYEKGKLYQIPITDLKPDPDNPTRHFCRGKLRRTRPGRESAAPGSDLCRGGRSPSAPDGRAELHTGAVRRHCGQSQERGMITAYNAYRLKQQEANESGGQAPNQPPGKNPNDPQNSEPA